MFHLQPRGCSLYPGVCRAAGNRKPLSTLTVLPLLVLFSEESLPASECTMVGASTESKRFAWDTTHPHLLPGCASQRADSGYRQCLLHSLIPPPRWGRMVPSAGACRINPCHLSPPHLLAKSHYTASFLALIIIRVPQNLFIQTQPPPASSLNTFKLLRVYPVTPRHPSTPHLLRSPNRDTMV